MVKVKLRKIGILKMAYFAGIYGALIGILAAIITLIWTLILSAVSIPGLAGQTLTLPALGYISLILFPIGYGILGFIGALILTPIMNLILKIIKGLEFDLDEQDEISHEHEHHTTSPKPPKQESHNIEHHKQYQMPAEVPHLP